MREILARLRLLWLSWTREVPPDCEYCGDPKEKELVSLVGLVGRAHYEWRCHKVECVITECGRLVGPPNISVR